MPRGLFVWFLVALAWLAAGTATRAATLEEAWRNVAEGRYREALSVFKQRQQAADPLGREARVGEAIVLLNIQPRLPANLARAREMCLSIVAPAAPEDDWTLQAHYLLARIAAYHRDPPDLEAARRHYTWLFTRYPQSEIAQAARVRHAILELHTAASPAERLARYNTLRATENAFSGASARRDFHLAMADACFFYDLGVANALHHCLAALEAGIHQHLRRANVTLRVAELASELGQRDLAREHYARFLDITVHGDARAQWARDRMAALDGAGQP